MLHLRKKDHEYKIDSKIPFGKQLVEFESHISAYSYNSKVLVVLVESGLVQEMMDPFGDAHYPRFLICLVQESDRNYIKETALRMLIKHFGKKNI